MIAMVVPCDVGVKAGAWIVFLVIHAYVAYICSKVIKTHYKIETVTKKFEGVNFKGVNFKMVKLVKQGQIKFERDASESKGVIERHCIIPAKVMLYRLCRSKPEGANKGTWINEADADESEKVSAFMGGYSELFACYDVRFRCRNLSLCPPFAPCPLLVSHVSSTLYGAAVTVDAHA